MSDDTEVPEVESRAREMGWVPEEEFKGPKEKWKSAEDFVEFGERLNPILKKQRDEFKSETERLKAQVSSMEGSLKDLLELQKTRLNEEHEAQIKYLKSQIRSAKKENDLDTADALEDELEKVQNNPPKVPEPQKPAQVSKEFLQFVEANKDWYEKDEDITDFAVGVAQKIRTKSPNMAPAEFFAELEKRVRATFSTKLQKSSPNMVDSGNTTTGGKPKGKTFEAMPSEAREQYKKTKESFPKLTKEEFSAMYWGE